MNTSKELLSKMAIKKGIFPSDIAFTPEEADRFIDYIIDQSALKNHVRIERMNKESKLIRAIGLGTGNILYPAAAFDSDKVKKAINAGKITLQSKKARGAAVVYDDDLEDNIEGEKFVDHLLQMIGKQIANELEQAYYLAAAVPDGVTPKQLTDLWNGWRHRILNQSNAITGAASVLDARSSSDFSLANGYIAEQNASAPYNWEFKFSKMLKVLPSKYKTFGLQNFRFFLNDQLIQDYIDALAARATVMGDQAIVGKGELSFGTVPLVPVPLMPTNLPVPKSGGGSSTVASNASAGQKTLTVASATGFNVGDYVHITKAGLEYKSEIHKIASINTNTLTFEDNLEWDHLAADAESVVEVTLDGADVVLTHKENFIIGIQRDIRMETERKASEEATYFYWSLRTDIAVENLNAVVFLKNAKVR